MVKFVVAIAYVDEPGVRFPPNAIKFLRILIFLHVFPYIRKLGHVSLERQKLTFAEHKTVRLDGFSRGFSPNACLALRDMLEDEFTYSWSKIDDLCAFQELEEHFFQHDLDLKAFDH